MNLPKFYRINQDFGSDPGVEDIEAAARHAVMESGIAERIEPGAEVAVTGGSRGIHNIPEILRSVGVALREVGASPFVITAMGSHGGGTTVGQLAVLEELGITEDSVDMPVRSTMATLEVGTTPEGMPVFLDAIANESAGVFIVGRVKKHTDFHGPIESGLCKMMALGLGKVRQANFIHANRPGGFPATIEALARVMVGTGKILGGMAIIENRFGETAFLTGVPAEEIPDREKELLKQSYEYFPMLPFTEADILIVRRMGKNISGTGMDTNTLGRMYVEGEPEPAEPFIQLVGILELTRETEGNAAGIGLADLTTRRLFESIDYQKTNLNTITSNFLIRAKIPITLENDRELLETAIGAIQGPFRGSPRIGIIEDTLSLESILVSEPLKENLNGSAIIAGEEPLEFDHEGNIGFEKP